MDEPGSGGGGEPEVAGGGDDGRGAIDAEAEGAGSESPARRVRRGVLWLTAVLVVYYAIPVTDLPSDRGLVLSVLGLLGGVTVLGSLSVRQVRRLARSAPGDETVRLESLILLVYVVVPVFAHGYLALERSDPGQFDGLATKTDALYFALSTIATVGFGDVHAAGQLARALVSIQIAFDLVFVAVLVSLLSAQIRERAESRRAAAAAAPPTGGAG